MQEQALLTVYGSGICPRCNAVKEYLESKKVPFNYVNVTTDDEAMDLLTLMGHQTLPVLRIGDKYITEFNIKELNTLIKEA